MNSIQALMEALKRTGTGSKLDLPDDDKAEPVAMRVQIAKAVPVGKEKADPLSHLADMMPDDMTGLHVDDDGNSLDSSDDDENAEFDAKIVGALQADYPQLYEQIVRKLQATSDEDHGLNLAG